MWWKSTAMSGPLSPVPKFRHRFVQRTALMSNSDFRVRAILCMTAVRPRLSKTGRAWMAALTIMSPLGLRISPSRGKRPKNHIKSKFLLSLSLYTIFPSLKFCSLPYLPFPSLSLSCSFVRLIIIKIHLDSNFCIFFSFDPLPHKKEKRYPNRQTTEILFSSSDFLFYLHNNCSRYQGRVERKDRLLPTAELALRTLASISK